MGIFKDLTSVINTLISINYTYVSSFHTDYQLFVHYSKLVLYGLIFTTLVVMFIFLKQDKIVKASTINMKTDHLTGFYNRRFLDAYKLKPGSSVAVLDIDFFKNINDEYGHISGDTVLVSASDLLRAHFRNEDILVRFGGDEFVIIMNNTEADAAYHACERFRKLLSSYEIELKNTPVKITCTIGIHFDMFEADVYTMIDKADVALYKAKETGRNMTCLS